MISLIIPYLESDEGKPAILRRCIESFEGQYDELIIVPDKDKSLAEKINKGLRLATHRFMIVSNDDVIAKSGYLRNLCVPGEVHSPVVHGGINKIFHAHLFSLPRDVYEKVGEFDESCPSAYFIDSDYWIRLLNADIPVVMNETVHIDHPEPARTLSKTNENQESARNWFIEKHGKDALRIIQ